MYEAKLEFPMGWGGVIGQIPSVGGVGYGYFLDLHFFTLYAEFVEELN